MFDKSFSDSPYDDGYSGHETGHSAIVRSFSAGAERAQLDEMELKTVLRSIEAALAVYTARDGKLSAQDISLKSMLVVIHGQVVGQLLRESNEAAIS